MWNSSLNKAINSITVLFNRNRRKLPSPTHAEMILIDELKDVARSYSNYSDPELEMSTAGREWLQNIQILSSEILNDDPRYFLNWGVIRNTMFVANAPYISKELKFIREFPNWNTRWKIAIQESWVGYPDKFPGYRYSSGNLIHHAYQIANLENIAKFSVDKLDVVFEFGGGYGSMCRLFYNLGFRGKYIIYDLPLFSALQTYYLKSLGLQVNSGSQSENDVACLSNIEEVNSLLSTVSEKQSLFLATWSISEVPVSVRAPFIVLSKRFNHFLFSFQEQFGEVNNLDFFKQYSQTTKKKIRWTSNSYSHIPGNYYLIGEAI